MGVMGQELAQQAQRLAPLQEEQEQEQEQEEERGAERGRGTMGL